MSLQFLFNKIKEKIPKALIEPKQDIQREAIKYCKKENDFVEFCTHKNQGTQIDIKEVKNLIESDLSFSNIL